MRARKGRGISGRGLRSKRQAQTAERVLKGAAKRRNREAESLKADSSTTSGVSSLAASWISRSSFAKELPLRVQLHALLDDLDAGGLLAARDFLRSLAANRDGLDRSSARASYDNRSVTVDVAQATSNSLIVLNVGPFERWQDVEKFRHILGRAVDTTVEFSAFSGGIFTLEVRTEDVSALLDWLRLEIASEDDISEAHVELHVGAAS